MVIGQEVLAEGIISRDTSWARDVTQSAKNGFPWQASMGGPIHQTEYVPFGRKATVNGQTFEGELYIIRKMTLKEISFVDLAADEHTSAVIEAQLEEKENLEMTKSSENQAEQPPENKRKTSVPIMTPVPQIDTVKMMAEFQQKMLIDQRRIAAIEKIGGGKLPDLEAKAIEDGWAVGKFHAEFQSQTMPDATMIPVTGAQPGLSSRLDGRSPAALEAIALATSGSSMKFLESQYDEKTLDQIDKFRGVGVQEFCELACGGHYLPKYRRDSRGWLEAAFSSASLPGILSNIANKVLLEGFLTMDDTWKKIAKIASVNNFQQHRRYRMNGAFKFEKIGADGEIKHGQISEQAFSQQVDTFAIMFALTRQMIIDDDLGAFSDIPRGIGVGAAEAISDAVFNCTKIMQWLF